MATFKCNLILYTVMENLIKNIDWQSYPISYYLCLTIMITAIYELERFQSSLKHLQF